MRRNAMNFAALGIMVGGIFATGGIAMVAYGESNTVPSNNRTHTITVTTSEDDPTTSAIPMCPSEDGTSDNCFWLSNGDGYDFVVIDGKVIYLAGECPTTNTAPT